MGRFLAIDYGQKRVGIAVTDVLKMIASPLTTVRNCDLFDFLKTYLQKEPVDCFVVGYPKQLNNQPSESARFVDPFLKQLKKHYPDMLIELIDERFTSKIAFQTMIYGGVKKSDRKNKATIDTVSATIILQSYLEQTKNK